MRMRSPAALVAVLMFAAGVHAELPLGSVVIPDVKQATQRSITSEDIAALRYAETLSISPDGKRFAVVVRQGDSIANAYRTGWFVGTARGGPLVFVGSGGQAQLRVMPTGHVLGDIAGSESRWSPDGRWIAYVLWADGEGQVWRSRADGQAREQVTHSASDVREFEWSEDGDALYFSAGTPRAEQQTRDRMRSQQGYRYDEDIHSFADFMGPKLLRAPETTLTLRLVTLSDGKERLANNDERLAFERIRTQRAGGIETANGFAVGAAVPAVRRADGASAWSERVSRLSRNLNVRAMLNPPNATPTNCVAPECSGVINKVWWSQDGGRVLFWRSEGIGDRAHGFYAWSPSSGAVATIAQFPDDDLRLCSEAADDRLICVRETKLLPPHVVAIDLRSGAIEIVADLNPEFRNIRLNKVERFEWETPKLVWNEQGGELEGLYPKRAYGYIYYPPGFDARRKYPVFIEPYIANGFNSSAGSEHALHVYAANGFVVLNAAFPFPTDVAARLGAGLMKQEYSAKLDFPHLTMLMESTVRGLDVVAARGFIDEHRIGVGGVSHGTFVPLYMMQKHDRIAAISVTGTGWGPHQYYWATAKGRRSVIESRGDIGYDDWEPKPEGEGRDFWAKIDIADHVDEIEAPILMNLAASETWPSIRFIRHLVDAGLPYDAYVFDKETHLKWQPAHLVSIMNRNLDWFRFWLQDYEDPAPRKKEQYARWHQLRDSQCKNPRSLRDYCRAP